MSSKNGFIEDKEEKKEIKLTKKRLTSSYSSNSTENPWQGHRVSNSRLDFDDPLI